jgi:hypothetical protein
MSKVAQEKEIGRLIARLDAHVGEKMYGISISIVKGNSAVFLHYPRNMSVEAPQQIFSAPTLAEALTETLGAIEDKEE